MKKEPKILRPQINGTFQPFSVDGIRIGYFTVIEEVDCTELLILKVFKRFRDKGYGSKIIQEVVNQFHKKTISLYVRRENKIAIHLYFKHGFWFDNTYKDENKYKMVYNQNIIK